MAKRKSAVNDIIYELDHDDIEISSEDEVRQPKIIRIEGFNSPNTTQSDSNTQSSCIEVIDIDSSTEKFDDNSSPKAISRNGGKSPVEFIILDEASNTASPKSSAPDIERGNKLTPDTIFNEEIIVDSPTSDSDPGVLGCENRTPLLTVKFRDRNLAMNYKKQIRAFLLNLIKHHENGPVSDNETDLELDIWPENVTEDLDVELEEPADNLYFIDTEPCDDVPVDIPSYSQNTSMISNISGKEPSPSPKSKRKGPTCFNCDGSHVIRECTMPRNNAKIAENRKAMARMGRYHIEDEQKFGHLVPGRISGVLRHALGLKRHELPMHIYRMRQLGYPPGWLEEARISHSGIRLFDSSGQATLDPEDEEGEVFERGSKDKFDIKKIPDFPGFNVPASLRYKEEAHKLGLPPMSEQDSKMAMLQVLAPNAMKAYKRKKLTFFPSASGQVQEGAAEMDIDSGDEIADFPSQPPLPDDAPPPPPPPPKLPPPPPPPPKSPPPPPKSPPPPPPDSPPPLQPPKDKKETPAPTKSEKPPADTKQDKPCAKKDPTAEIKQGQKPKQDKTESDDDVELFAVLKMKNIPMPFTGLITIDVDGDVSEPEGGLTSPSLDDLEQKKRFLLNALGEPLQSMANILESKENEKIDISEPQDVTKDAVAEDSSHTTQILIKIVDHKVEDGSIDKSVDDKVADDSTEKAFDDVTDSSVDKPDKITDDSINKPIDNKVADDTINKKVDDKVANDLVDEVEVESSSINSTPKVAKEAISIENDTDLLKTPISTVGLVRGTEYGTPVINVASPYNKLPSDDKFAKDICDVINFENLPNSIGKYKKISTLLKKVKSEVERIQES